MTEDCCACSGLAVATVIDGAFAKPVCVSHARMYADDGYTVR